MHLTLTAISMRVEFGILTINIQQVGSRHLNFDVGSFHQ
jgi:hypothetical protein